VNKEAEEALLANVKSITDRLDMVDEVFKQLRVGRNMVLVFQCGHSGLYLPGDYVKNWGKLYGIGLGPSPVSESLQSEYDVAPPALTPEIQTLEQIMHPLRSSCAQMDTALVEAGAFRSNSAVLVLGDEKMKRRAPILYAKQVANPRGRLGLTRAAWANLGRNV